MSDIVMDEKERYGCLLAGILRQTIVDYVLSRRAVLHLTYPKAKWNHEERIKSCVEFFNDPPYDYGDIDFRYLQRLCEEKVREPGRMYIKADIARISEW